MRYLFISLHVVILIFSLFSIGYAYSWTKYFSIEPGYDFFYDENVTKYKDNTFLIWNRTIPQKNTKSNSWIELIEIDCSLKRYKRLRGRRKYENKPLQKIGESSWANFEPYDFDIAFYNTACSNRRDHPK